MDILNREGPITIAHRSCLGCVHLFSKMLLSGRNPVYEYRCRALNEVGKPDDIFASDCTRLIGNDTNTPNWCQYTAKSQYINERGHTGGQRDKPADELDHNGERTDCLVAGPGHTDGQAHNKPQPETPDFPCPECHSDVGHYVNCSRGICFTKR